MGVVLGWPSALEFTFTISSRALALIDVSSSEGAEGQQSNTDLAAKGLRY